MPYIPHYLILQYVDLKTFQSFILTCKDNLNDCKKLYLWKIHQYYLRCGYWQWYVDRNPNYKPDFFYEMIRTESVYILKRMEYWDVIHVRELENDIIKMFPYRRDKNYNYLKLFFVYTENYIIFKEEKDLFLYSNKLRDFFINQYNSDEIWFLIYDENWIGKKGAIENLKYILNKIADWTTKEKRDAWSISYKLCWKKLFMYSNIELLRYFIENQVYPPQSMNIDKYIYYHVKRQRLCNNVCEDSDTHNNLIMYINNHITLFKGAEKLLTFEEYDPPESYYNSDSDSDSDLESDTDCDIDSEDGCGPGRGWEHGALSGGSFSGCYDY